MNISRIWHHLLGRQIIDLYAVCWNDIRILPFFMRHYQPWISRFIIFDDGSTDGSLEFLSRFSNVEVRQFKRQHSDSLVDSHRDMYNTCWRKSRRRADWVVITNLDEHLYHPNLMSYLASSKKAGVTAIPGLGCQMVSDEFPSEEQQLCHSVTSGMPWSMMSKLSLFDPKQITATNYAVGRHSAQPAGNVVYPDRDELLNLHYKYLGLSYLKERSTELGSGLRSRDIEENWGHKYLWDEDKIRQDFMTVMENSINVMDAKPEQIITQRWWREN